MCKREKVYRISVGEIEAKKEMSNCRYCDLPIVEPAAATHSYWQGLRFECHQVCKRDGEQSEALECQIIDADCNDCRHFKRGQIVPLPVNIQKAMAAGECSRFTTETWTGHCLKFDKPTVAFPKKWTGRECFEHRRA